jgi:phosphonate transport system ATP-binding protein
MKYCPRVIALHQGQVVYDGPSAALTPQLLRELYGVQVDELLAPPAPPVAAPLSAPGHSHTPPLWNAHAMQSAQVA